ncbi:hypothetical protein B0H11DRAFT_1900043 [Mycena galericulata]|nr:hypothetical protein B0H11DRAFT_1900043 [Mycena galericulata]
MTRLTGLRRVFRLMMSYTLCTRRESLAAIAATVPVCAAPITRCSALKTPVSIFFDLHDLRLDSRCVGLSPFCTWGAGLLVGTRMGRCDLRHSVRRYNMLS